VAQRLRLQIGGVRPAGNNAQKKQLATTGTRRDFEFLQQHRSLRDGSAFAACCFTCSAFLMVCFFGWSPIVLKPAIGHDQRRCDLPPGRNTRPTVLGGKPRMGRGIRAR